MGVKKDFPSTNMEMKNNPAITNLLHQRLASFPFSFSET
jgi:hypothetical protein